MQDLKLRTKKFAVDCWKLCKNIICWRERHARANNNSLSRARIMLMPITTTKLSFIRSSIMSRKYKFKNPIAAYFVSFATVYWIDVFTRQVYFSILEESITYCREEKGMEVFAFCFMPSHVHIIFRSD